MIRQATAEDVPRVAEMAMRFIAAAGKPEGRPAEVEAVVRGMVGGGGCFVSERGMILGIVAPLYYRPDYLEAHEVAWWCEDGAGLRLLRAFEQWARDRGAREIVMSTLPDYTARGAHAVLTRRGYRHAEAGYRKAI